MMQPVNRDTARRYAWVNVAVGFVTYCYMLGFPSVMMPVIYPSIMADMEWSRGATFSFSSFKFFTGATASFFFGFFIARYGVKPMLLTAAVINAVSMGAFLLIDSLPVYYLIAVGYGLGATASTVCIKVMLSNWFNYRQGRAIAIALMGSGLAGVIAPFVAQFLADNFGWRHAVFYLSLGIWLVMLPVVFFFTRANPEEYGHTSEELDPTPTDVPTPPFAIETQPTFAQAARTRPFVLIALSVFLIGFVEQGFNQHMKTYLQLDVGFSAAVATAAFSAYQLISVGGRWLFGWVFDRKSVAGVSFSFVIIAIAGLLAFPVTGTVTMALFVIFRGLGHGAVLVDIPVLVRHVFGRREVAKLIGVLTGVYNYGMAFGPSFFGFSFDATGSYTIAFTTGIVLALVAAALLVPVQPRFWIRPSQRRKVASTVG